MRYLSVCSGYCAATLAWRPLGWECAGFAEIDAFPAAMLGAHYGATRPRYMPDPDAPGIPAKERTARLKQGKAMARLGGEHFGNQVVNFGDFTQIREDDVGPIDTLVGGTPCQSFSQAGKRLGLDDPRGNLTLEFLALARRLRARRVVWENVTGFLSHDGGRTLGTFLGFMGQLGYRWAYRVLDAQWVRVASHPRAVPQRRKRIIVVGYLGEGPHPGAILFDPESMRGDSPPRREPGQRTAETLGAGSPSSGGYRLDADTSNNLIAEVAPTIDASFGRLQGCSGQDALHGHSHLIAAFGGNNTSGPIEVSTALSSHGGPHGRLDFESETFIAEPVPFDTTQITSKANGSNPQLGDPCHALASGAHPPAIAYSIMPQNSGKDYTAREVQVAPPLMAAGPGGGNQGGDIVATEWRVRRLIVTECERLMGVPDGFTDIMYRGKPAADGPRYKVLGNSMATNMMRQIGVGIQQAEDAWQAFTGTVPFAGQAEADDACGAIDPRAETPSRPGSSPGAPNLTEARAAA